MRRVEAGIMPLGGYKGQPGAKLPSEDIEILRQWIDAGGPGKSRRPFIAESQVLDAIDRDLESANVSDRLYLRYFSLANIWNNGEIDDAELRAYPTALNKLVNHLSWEKAIAAPRAVNGAEGEVFCVDLRNYGWTPEIWRGIAAAYPYGGERQDLTGTADRIEDLSGADVGYVRADWFIAAASVAPLYHTILGLPSTLAGLEQLLDVHAEFDLDRNIAERFGVRNSGVSRNNRAIERHSTAYGAYWKSFDFAGNAPEQNIFRNPLDMRADGGEIIFNLPNGLQAYLIVDRQGRRIDAAPVNVVRDRTNSDDPVVHNGRSCIGCHAQGMNVFKDEIHEALEGRTQALFNVERALEIYRGQEALDLVLRRDNSRFSEALRRIETGPPPSPAREPVSRLARQYEGAVSVSQAAADLFLEDPKALQSLIRHNLELQTQGFDSLLGPGGTIKRDSWEQGFSVVKREAEFRAIP
jgi:hypothetical protein